jgi:hypothetical protein
MGQYVLNRSISAFWRGSRKSIGPGRLCSLQGVRRRLNSDLTAWPPARLARSRDTALWAAAFPVGARRTVASHRRRRDRTNDRANNPLREHEQLERQEPIGRTASTSSRFSSGRDRSNTRASRRHPAKERRAQSGLRERVECPGARPRAIDHESGLRDLRVHGAKVFPSIEDAQHALCPPYKTFTPDKSAHAVYDQLFPLYRALYFGLGDPTSAPVAMGDVLPRLREIAADVHTSDANRPRLRSSSAGQPLEELGHSTAELR